MSAIQIIEFSAPEIEEGEMRDEVEIKKTAAIHHSGSMKFL